MTLSFGRSDMHDSRRMSSRVRPWTVFGGNGVVGLYALFVLSGFLMFQVKGFKFQVSGFKFQIEGFRLQAREKVAGFKFQVAGRQEGC